MPNPLFGAALGVCTVLCWSSYNVAAKHGIDLGVASQTLAFLRFCVPGLIAVPILVYWQLAGGMLAISITRILVLVLLGGPIFGVVAVNGYMFAPLSHGMLFAPVAVFVSGIVLGTLLLKEKPSKRRFGGALGMFVGLAILVGFETTDGVPLWPIGAAFFVLAGAMWGAYTVLLRLWRIPILEGTLLVAAGSSLLALPLLGPWAIADMATLPPSQLALQTMMQGLIGGVLSVICLLGAVNALPNHVVVLLPTFTPSVALMITVLLGQKSPTPAEILGTIIITLAFIWSTKNKQEQTSQPATNAT